MARYTGPSYKQSRRVGFSLTETGKELAKRPYYCAYRCFKEKKEKLLFKIM